MAKQIIFAIVLLITLGIFAYTINRYIRFFRFTKPAFPVKDFAERMKVMMNVAFGQTKILRRPVVGALHALVFWGFCIILFGSIEMIIDGLFGFDRSLNVLGPVYDVLIATGDIFALIVGISILAFLVRRVFMHIRRFSGIEMKHISHLDANIALTLILLLMVSLLGMNMAYCGLQAADQEELAGIYPVSENLCRMFASMTSSQVNLIYETFWWMHILLIFAFANILPYSKHFHVFMSVPNVFLSRLYPLGKLPNMESVTREVKLMLNPDATQAPGAEVPFERFGVKDVEDVSWKNYLDSLACTECGRCTAACPANITGKRLSPRKIIMDVRARMKEKGPLMVKNGKEFNDNRALLRSFISEEELWACTTCQACAMECPININHPTLIIDMRRYLVMEEGAAPGGLKVAFSNIENNGAPWQYSSEDRILWTNDISINTN
jgi:heterodisulfide reductase subunit C/nitrate reductase gamma subunit